MKYSLDFSIDSFELREMAKNARFCKCLIKAFATGDNAHTIDTSLETIKQSAKTIYDIPITYGLQYFNKDFASHEKIQYPMGFVKDSVNNPIVFGKEEDGRVFLTIEGTIWRRYTKHINQIFEKSNGKKSVSVEMTVLDSEETDRGLIIKDFVFEGITVLGDNIKPAVQGAQLQLQFSEDKKNFLSLSFSDKDIKIDNTKEASVDGKWVNPRNKLLSPILNAKNKTSLLKEAYLVVKDESNEGITLSDVSYPHHVIREGKLVLHVSGLQAAFSRASQQGIVSGEVKKHLLRHYRELGLSRENFAELGLTENLFNLYYSLTKKGEKELNLEKIKELFSNKLQEIKYECTDNEKVYNLNKFGIKDCKEEEVILYDFSENKVCSLNYTLEDEDLKFNIDDLVYSEEEISEEDKKYFEDYRVESIKKSMEDEEDLHKDEEEQEDIEEIKVLLEELKLEKEKYEQDCNVYMEKINSMADYEELKSFKEMVLEERKKQEELSSMVKVMEDIESKGFAIDVNSKKELFEKINDFENINAWTNYVKAITFDKVKKFTAEEGIIDIPALHDIKKPNSIWD